MTAKGNELYKLLLRLTDDNIEADLDRILDDLGLNPDFLNTEDVRKVVATYLEQVDGEIKKRQDLEALLRPLAEA